MPRASHCGEDVETRMRQIVIPIARTAVIRCDASFVAVRVSAVCLANGVARLVRFPRREGGRRSWHDAKESCESAMCLACAPPTSVVIVDDRVRGGRGGCGGWEREKVA
jgi:hypothetical protein